MLWDYCKLDLGFTSVGDGSHQKTQPTQLPAVGSLQSQDVCALSAHSVSLEAGIRG